MSSLRLKAEVAALKRLITTVYPNGIVSYVADTYDFWGVVTYVLPKLKPDIMVRNGKLVVRPDSGDPVKIVCGDPEAPEGSPEHRGAFQCLWDVFGGETKDGYRHLDSHVGLIYGDSITLERQQAILSGLKAKGFAPSVVLGIGSFTYQMKTRDTFGFAMKATWGMVNGVEREIFKDPKTDIGGEKKSAKGLLQVYRDEEGKPRLLDQCDMDGESGGILRPVFVNGELVNETSFAAVRKELHGGNF